LDVEQRRLWRLVLGERPRVSAAWISQPTNRSGLNLADFDADVTIAYERDICLEGSRRISDPARLSTRGAAYERWTNSRTAISPITMANAGFPSNDADDQDSILNGKGTHDATWVKVPF
jgi:hypothetical protein